MAVTFQARGTQLNAWFSSNGKYWRTRCDEGQAPPSVDALADASVFGGHAINIYGVGGRTREILWPGYGNWTATNEFAVLVRLIPQFDGVPPDNQTIFAAGDHLNSATGGVYIRWNNDGTISVVAATNSGRTMLSWNTLAVMTAVNGVAMDIMLRWDGTVANKAQLSVNGVLFEEKTASDDLSAYQTDRSRAPVVMLSCGFGPASSGTSKFYINELVCFDNAQAVVYSPRTGFWTTTAAEFDATAAIDPGISHVESGRNYMIAGVALVGAQSLIAAAAATTKHGVLANDGVGTYRGADLWTSPRADQLALGVQLQSDSLTPNLTGTLDSVTISMTAGVLVGQSLECTLKAET